MKKTYNNGANAVDSALEMFSELIIDKLETMEESNWQKPWFGANGMAEPTNLTGRQYNGMNSIILRMYSESNAFKIPVFCTFMQLSALNKEKNGGQTILINKGAKSFPIYFVSFYYKNLHTGECISCADYDELTEERQRDFVKKPSTQIYRVFNVCQTNMETARPELWAKLKERYAIQTANHDGERQFCELDKILDKNGWLCPITMKKTDSAYYSITADCITLPTREQFKTLEGLYGTALHEMAHSTGAESRLKRLTSDNMHPGGYAVEELTAELTSAFVMSRNGFEKHIKADSIPYLRSWLNSLHEDRHFIKTILTNVKKATVMIEKCLNAQMDNADALTA